jgi:hypothetical protein
MIIENFNRIIIEKILFKIYIANYSNLLIINQNIDKQITSAVAKWSKGDILKQRSMD